MQLDNVPVHRLSGPMREHYAMRQEELDAASGGLVRSVFVEPENRPPRLVHGRMRGGRANVAIPSPVRPLRLGQRLGQPL